MYCMQCGTELPEGVRFCSKCGTAMPPYGARPLQRPRMGRQVAGVCLALSRSYGWDVAAVRIVAVLGLCLSAGLVGVAYLACWIGIPEEQPELPKVYPPAV